MKKILALATSLLLLLATSCQKEEPPVILESIQLNTTKLQLNLEQQYQFVVKLTPSEATYARLVWSSSNPSVVSVDAEGYVTSHSKEGMATITVKHEAENEKDVTLETSCEVTVKDPNAEKPEKPVEPSTIPAENGLVTGIVFPVSNYSLFVSDTLRLNKRMIVYPSYVTSKVLAEYSSSNEAVATVNAAGVVTAKAVGEAVIKAVINGHEAITQISVERLVGVQELLMDRSSISLLSGSYSIQLKALFVPENTSHQELVWTSSNPAVATVNEQGVVTAGNKSGSAVITATHKKMTSQDFTASASCVANVVSPADFTYTTYTVKDQKFEFAYVEGGTFMMGGTEEQGEDGQNHFEQPVHEVTLSSFYILKTEVTNAQYEAVCRVFSPSSQPSYPKTRMSTYEPIAFCEDLSRVLGMTVQLPTEAQWEFAARGGVKSKGTKYPGSNEIDDVAWYQQNAGNTLHPVAQKWPNELGLYDMAGNAREWTNDFLGDYKADPQTNPTGPTAADYKVVRGGSFSGDAHFARVSCRFLAKYFETDLKPDDLGFRVVIIPSKK